MKARNLLTSVGLMIFNIAGFVAPAHGATQPCVSVTCPNDIALSSPSNQVVNYAVPVPVRSTNCSGISNVTVLCVPPPNSTFPLGTTLVRCDLIIGGQRTNGCTFNVTIGSIPSISSPIVTRTITNRQSISFSPVVSGVPLPAYQWRLNDSIIPGATNSSYAVMQAGREDSGNYSIVASNALGVDTALVARLTVYTPAFDGPLIRTGSVWKYLFNGGAPPEKWLTASFNDGPWRQGPGEFGFGNGTEATVIGSSTSNFVTAYFRKTFNLGIPQSISNLTLNLRRDDGAVVYLNATEVFRSNMPTGAIANSTLASAAAPDDGRTPISVSLDPDRLVAGTNVLAVEIHQVTPGNIDLTFEAELVSCPIDPTIPCGPPVILAPPQNLTVMNGSPAFFAVSVAQTPPMGFQWLFHGTNLPGATGSTLTLVRAGQEHQGPYRVRITNAFGATLSPAANLNVYTPALIGPLVPTGSVWKYLFTGLPAPAGWIRSGFNDGTWSSGPGVLGFGDNPATIIGNPTDRYMTAYFRKPFLVSTPQSVSNLVLSLRRDDGVVVYLNEVEIYRNNMPTGEVTYITPALVEASDDGRAIYSANIAPRMLVVGSNILAAEVHQWSLTSTDLSFDLSLWSCPAGAARLSIIPQLNQVTVTWSNSDYRLQGAVELPGPTTTNQWLDLPQTSPAVFLRATNPYRYFRLVCP